MTFEEFKQIRYTHIPGDFLYNELGFKNDAETGIYSDISAHLPMLEFLASRCEHITEFGVRDCYSTVAFISSCRGKVISYDVNLTPSIEFLQSLQDSVPCTWEFKLADTTNKNLKIEQTDLLFIDTLHTYDQVKKELELHSDKVNRFIVFHDTYSQWDKSLDNIEEEGIGRAIEEFLKENTNWIIVYQVFFNHGLIAIEKRGSPCGD
jgi:hypothetical protein